MVDSQKPQEHDSINVTNAEYRTSKRRLLKYEEKNYNTIAIIPCSGDKGWCELGDHSALIYYYKVCYPAGIKVNFDIDASDYYNKFRYGKIKTRGFDVVRKRLKQSGLFQHELIRDGRAIFTLNVTYSQKDIDEMWVDEQSRRNKIGRILKVEFADPAIHQAMIHVAVRLHGLCLRRLDKLSSSTIGKKIIEEIDGILRKYYEMTDNKTARKKDWQELLELCRALSIDLQIVSELGLWTREKCAEIGAQVLELQERLEKRYAACKTE